MARQGASFRPSAPSHPGRPAASRTSSGSGCYHRPAQPVNNQELGKRIARDKLASNGCINKDGESRKMAEITDVTDATFESEVLKSETPVLVDFWAEWCAPCRRVAPIVKEIADSYGERLKVVKINIDDSPQVPGNYGIRSIPTILAFKDGQVVSQLVGLRPKGDFEEMVERVL
jgi:thioredoxin 1